MCLCVCLQNYLLDFATIAIGLAAARIHPITEMTRHKPEPKLLPRREYLLLSITVALWLVFDILSFGFFTLESPLGKGNGTAYLVTPP